MNPTIFRIRDRPRERLREIEITGELGDARVIELVRTEVRLVIVERRCQRIEHAIDIPRMRRVIVNGEIDTSMLAMLNRVACRLNRESRMNRRTGHEARHTPAALYDIRHFVARGERRLIRGCRHSDVSLRPTPPNSRLGCRGGILQLRRPGNVRKPILPSLLRILKHPGTRQRSAGE